MAKANGVFPLFNVVKIKKKSWTWVFKLMSLTSHSFVGNLLPFS